MFLLVDHGAFGTAESDQSCAMIFLIISPGVLLGVDVIGATVSVHAESLDIIFFKTSLVFAAIVPDVVFFRSVAYFCDSKGILTVKSYPIAL